jgi:hypothetical protein
LNSLLVHVAAAKEESGEMGDGPIVSTAPEGLICDLKKEAADIRACILASGKG